jgi:steroid delta-isomerase-like uncharacterized protein
MAEEGRPTMSIEENKALVRRVLELLNERDTAAAFEYYAPDYIYHGPGGQELGGREGIKGLWAVFFAAFPDLGATIEDMVAEGDKLVLRWRVQGTHKGEFQGIAPTNKQVTLPLMEMFRVAGGQLAEAWDSYDRLDLMQQLGAIPQ